MSYPPENLNQNLRRLRRHDPRHDVFELGAEGPLARVLPAEPLEDRLGGLAAWVVAGQEGVVGVALDGPLRRHDDVAWQHGPQVPDHDGQRRLERDLRRPQRDGAEAERVRQEAAQEKQRAQHAIAKAEADARARERWRRRAV